MRNGKRKRRRKERRRRGEEETKKRCCSCVQLWMIEFDSMSSSLFFLCSRLMAIIGREREAIAAAATPVLSCPAASHSFAFFSSLLLSTLLLMMGLEQCSTHTHQETREEGRSSGIELFFFFYSLCLCLSGENSLSPLFCFFSFFSSITTGTVIHHSVLV